MEVMFVVVLFGVILYRPVRFVLEHRRRLTGPDALLQRAPTRSYTIDVPGIEPIPESELTERAAASFTHTELPHANWFGGRWHERLVALRMQSEPLPYRDDNGEPLFRDAMWIWTPLDEAKSLPRTVIRAHGIEDDQILGLALTTYDLRAQLGEEELVVVSHEGVSFFSMTAWKEDRITLGLDLIHSVAKRIEGAAEDLQFSLRNLLMNSYETEQNEERKAELFIQIWKLDTQEREGPSWTGEREAAFATLVESATTNSALSVQVALAELEEDDAKLTAFACSAEIPAQPRIRATGALIRKSASNLEQVLQSVLQNASDQSLLALALAHVVKNGPPHAAKWLQAPASDLREDAAEAIITLVRNYRKAETLPVLMALANHRSEQISVEAIAMVGTIADGEAMARLKEIVADDPAKEIALQMAVEDFGSRRTLGALSVVEPESQGALSLDKGLEGSLAEVSEHSSEPE